MEAPNTEEGNTALALLAIAYVKIWFQSEIYV